MNLRTMLTACVVASVCAGNAAAQSFNVDSDTGVAGNPAQGAPSAAFAGAAGQPGTWNAISGIATTSIPLLNLNGSASGVTFDRQSAAGGNFAFDNANSSGDFQLLMDDGYDFSAQPPGFIWFRFNGLQNGTYEVYSYALAPDFAADFTDCRVGTDAGTLLVCGGAMPNNSFTAGVTHVVHTVTVTNGVLEMQYDGQVSSASFGTLNGVQIKLLPGAQCPADINDDGQVNVTDLLAVIAAWNATGANPADINGDLVVNVTDLLAVIAAWGPCP